MTRKRCTGGVWMLKLVSPTPAYREQVLDYQREFREAGEHAFGTSSLDSAQTFEDWYQEVVNNSRQETVQPGLVPANQYLGVVEETGEVVGMLNLRHYLNDSLLRFGGHIGYSVRKSQRRKGYAGALIRAVQEMLLSQGPVRLYAHVAKRNTPSLRTHSACGFQKIQDSAVYIDGSADSRSVTLLFEYPKNISNFGK